MKVFAKNFCDCQILLRIDNTTAISYVNRMGGLRFPHLNSLSKSLWQFCEERNIFVFASYVSSQDNKIADAESRRQHPDTESDVVFNIIVIQLGVPDIDLFASRTNNKCHRYMYMMAKGSGRLCHYRVYHRSKTILFLCIFTLWYYNKTT